MNLFNVDTSFNPLSKARKPRRCKIRYHHVLVIKYRLEAGESQKDIAKRYDCSQQLISDINTGKIWSRLSSSLLDYSKLYWNYTEQQFNQTL